MSELTPLARRAALRLFAGAPALAILPAAGVPSVPSAAGLTEAQRALVIAIGAHAAAQFDLDAVPSGDEDAFADACALETEALEAVAEAPCESDADFFVKAAYLIKREREAWGTELSEHEPFGLLALATELHMEGRQ
jgi:hypothetical protein